jgi:putative heme-binding domain-containing protein
MLLGIINPHAEIREGFETLTILTDDGRVITGFKIDEDANSLVLRTVDGQSQTINKAWIEEQHRSKTSLMPTGLLDELSDAQIRDLFAFLTSTTPPN